MFRSFMQCNVSKIAATMWSFSCWPYLFQERLNWLCCIILVSLFVSTVHTWNVPDHSVNPPKGSPDGLPAVNPVLSVWQFAFLAGETAYKPDFQLQLLQYILKTHPNEEEGAARAPEDLQVDVYAADIKNNPDWYLGDTLMDIQNSLPPC